MKRYFWYVGAFLLGILIVGTPIWAVNYPNVAVMDPRTDSPLAVDRSGLIGFNNFPAAFDVNLPNPLPVSLSGTLPVSVAATLPVSLATTIPVSVATTLPVSIATTLPISGSVTIAQGSSGPATPVACDQTARVANSSSAVLVAHVAAKSTYVCGYTLGLDLTLSATASLKWGTGTNCGSNTAQFSAGIQNAALGLLTNGSNAEGSGFGTIDQSPTPGTSDLCVVISGGGTATGSVRYASF